MDKGRLVFGKFFTGEIVKIRNTSWDEGEYICFDDKGRMEVKNERNPDAKHNVVGLQFLISELDGWEEYKQTHTDKES